MVKQARPVELDEDTLRTIRRIAAEMVASGECNISGGPSCGVASEEISRQLGWDQTYGFFVDKKGNLIDDDHAWAITPDGTIVDVAIQQFEENIDLWPGYGDIAVVPPKHPFYRHYVIPE